MTEKPKIKLNVRQPINEEMTVKEIIDTYIPAGWEPAFADARETLEHISAILEHDEKTQGKWAPRKQDLFRALELVRPHEVKVCIIGMDPYPGMCQDGLPQAMGLSFSVRRSEKIPSSLRNIFAELAQSVKEFNIPKHGDLTRWAHQGVLLLNACLTVRFGKSGSHKDLWAALTTSILKLLSSESPNCIYLLWGKKAQELQQHISGRAKILTAPHPSGLNNGREKTFQGCGHFVEVNKLLGEQSIDWNLDAS